MKKYDIKEAAKLLNVSTKTLRRYASRGLVSPKLIDGKLYYSDEDLARARGENRELLTIKEAAQKLGVTPTTLRNWEKQGKIKSLKTEGGHRRYNTAQVVAGNVPEQVYAEQVYVSSVNTRIRSFYLIFSASLVSLLLLFVSTISFWDEIKADYVTYSAKKAGISKLVAVNQSKVLAENVAQFNPKFVLNVDLLAPDEFSFASSSSNISIGAQTGSITINNPLLNTNDIAALDISSNSLTSDEIEIASLSINEDVFTDLTGSGLVVSEGVLAIDTTSDVFRIWQEMVWSGEIMNLTLF